MTVFYKIYFCQNAVLLQIYISVKKKQLSCGTVFLHNTCIYIAIYIYSFYVADQDTARYIFCSVQEECLSLAEPYTTDS